MAGGAFGVEGADAAQEPVDRDTLTADALKNIGARLVLADDVVPELCDGRDLEMVAGIQVSAIKRLDDPQQPLADLDVAKLTDWLPDHRAKSSMKLG
jgi:hypothetical protein